MATVKWSDLVSNTSTYNGNHDTTSGSYHYNDQGTWNTWPDPQVGTAPINPAPTGVPGESIVVEREVEVKTCPRCEETKRMEDHWTGNDYICDECRG